MARPILGPRLPNPGERWCNYGKHYVSDADVTHKKDGTWSAYCRKCSSERAKVVGRPKRKYQLLRARVIEALGGKCNSCGSADISHRLHVHHRDHLMSRDDREHNRGNNVYYRRALKQPEEFELLCSTCHGLRHRGHTKRKTP